MVAQPNAFENTQTHQGRNSRQHAEYLQGQIEIKLIPPLALEGHIARGSLGFQTGAPSW